MAAQDPDSSYRLYWRGEVDLMQKISCQFCTIKNSSRWLEVLHAGTSALD